MSAIFIIAWLGGMAASIYFIFRPKTEWPLVNTRGGAAVVLFAVFIGVPILGAVFLPADKSSKEDKRANGNVEVIDRVAQAPGESSKPEEKWQYSEETDAMRGTKTKFASLSSENELEFGFPYDGGHARLMLRRRPSDGLNVMLRIEAQFMCSQFSETTVAAKFDDGAIQNYRCTEPAAGTTGLLFIGGEERFVRNLRSAKTLILEAPFYQSGRKQMTFDVRNLKWD